MCLSPYVPLRGLSRPSLPGLHLSVSLSYVCPCSIWSFALSFLWVCYVEVYQILAPLVALVPTMQTVSGHPNTTLFHFISLYQVPSKWLLVSLVDPHYRPPVFLLSGVLWIVNVPVQSVPETPDVGNSPID